MNYNSMEPAGHKSRRLFLQAAKNYRKYLDTNYLLYLFKAQKHYRNAVKISASKKANYIEIACNLYGLSQEEFNTALNVDTLPER